MLQPKQLHIGSVHQKRLTTSERSSQLLSVDLDNLVVNPTLLAMGTCDFIHGALLWTSLAVVDVLG